MLHFIQWLAVMLIVMLVTVFSAVPVVAADLRGGDTITVAGGEVVDGNLHVSGTFLIHGYRLR